MSIFNSSTYFHHKICRKIGNKTQAFSALNAVGEKIVLESALYESLQSFSLKFSLSPFFSPNEYNHTLFPPQELNTASPCPFLILQLIFITKFVEKLVVKNASFLSFECCRMKNSRIMGSLCSTVDFSNSILYSVQSFEEGFIDCNLCFSSLKKSVIICLNLCFIW